MEKIFINSQKEFDELSYSNSNRSHKYLLENAIVNTEISLKEAHQNYPIIISFTNVVFNKQLKLNERYRVVKDLHFELCTFNEVIDFRANSFIDISIQNSIFGEKVDFTNSKFRRNTSIAFNEFLSEIVFKNCNFSQMAFFRKNLFYSKVNFEKSSFIETAFFSYSTFRKGVNFTDSKFSGKFSGQNISSHKEKADFTRVTFQSDSFLTQSHFVGGISLYGSIIKGSLDVTDIIVYGENSDHETLRIIKNLFLKQNNRIQVLKFHEKEMDAYRKSLNEDYYSLKKEYIKLKNQYNNLFEPEYIDVSNTKVHDKLYLKNFSTQEYKEYRKNYLRDKWILTFNKWSNNYGLSWAQGLKFIFGSSIFFYFLYVLSAILQGNYPFTFGWSNWTEFWNATDYTLKYYLQFLIPTHKFNFMVGVKTSFISHLIDFISRIVIGYGIYQMVQAFRKFGKI